MNYESIIKNFTSLHIPMHKVALFRHFKVDKCVKEDSTPAMLLCQVQADLWSNVKLIKCHENYENLNKTQRKILCTKICSTKDSL